MSEENGKEVDFSSNAEEGRKIDEALASIEGGTLRTAAEVKDFVRERRLAWQSEELTQSEPAAELRYRPTPEEIELLQAGLDSYERGEVFTKEQVRQYARQTVKEWLGKPQKQA